MKKIFYGIVCLLVLFSAEHVCAAASGRQSRASRWETLKSRGTSLREQARELTRRGSDRGVVRSSIDENLAKAIEQIGSLSYDGKSVNFPRNSITGEDSLEDFIDDLQIAWEEMSEDDQKVFKRVVGRAREYRKREKDTSSAKLDWKDFFEFKEEEFKKLG